MATDKAEKINKIINDPRHMTEDMLAGYLFLYGDLFEGIPGTKGGLKKRATREKVSVVIGGGGGNEPWCLGYVGEGLADALVCGNVYAAPPAIAILDVTRNLYHQKGVLYVGTNHMGDILNFELVGELAGLENIRTRSVFVNDDVASDLRRKENRRGVAGIALTVKIAGAVSEAGLDLDQCTEITKRAAENIRTISVTTSPGYYPGNGKAMFELPPGMMEYGMGFNGEPGILREPLAPARDIVRKMLSLLTEDLPLREKDESYALLINGFGFTSCLEMHIVAKETGDYFAEKGLPLYHADLKNIFCPQGTGGFSLSLLKIDETLAPFYDAPCESPLFIRERLRGGKRI